MDEKQLKELQTRLDTLDDQIARTRETVDELKEEQKTKELRRVNRQSCTVVTICLLTLVVVFFVLVALASVR